jgi:hypothetical protein
MARQQDAASIVVETCIFFDFTVSPQQNSAKQDLVRAAVLPGWHSSQRLVSDGLINAIHVWIVGEEKRGCKVQNEASVDLEALLDEAILLT